MAWRRGVGTRTAEEPLAESHIRFDLALLAGETVVLHTEQGIEWEGGFSEFVGVAELVLGRRKVEKGRAFEVPACFELGSGASRYKRRNGGWGNGDLGKLVEKQESIDVGGLRGIKGGESGSAMKKGQGLVE